MTLQYRYDYLGTELFNENFQVRIASNRGAARQYQKPWYIDVSQWYYVIDLDEISVYDPAGEWENEPASSPEGGHSVSLVERAFIMSYMSGANALMAEAGGAVVYDKIKQEARVAENGRLYVYSEK